MNSADEVDECLADIGLDSEDILSLKKRNKYLKITLKEDITEIFNFLYENCKLNKKEIRHIVLNNPFILNESLERMTLLNSIYKNIGFNNIEYRKYLFSCNKAFSMNPREVYERIAKLAESGNTKEQIKELMLKKGV